MTARRGRTFTPAARTAFRTASAGITGLAAFGAVAATGWVAAIAAGDYAREQDQKAARAEAAAERAAKERTAWLRAHPVVKVVDHRRAHRTVVRTVTVAAGTVTPGRGGTITRSPGTAVTQASSRPAGTTATQPSSPPPPPPPPPAPSSGS